MALKLFGQLIIIGGQIVGKVISGAYKQALANAAKNPNIAKNGGGKGGSTMTVDEAVKILNCQQNPSREDVLQRYEHLFRVNDRSAGGSFYLQSKVVRAREALELHLTEASKGKKPVG